MSIYCDKFQMETRLWRTCAVSNVRKKKLFSKNNDWYNGLVKSLQFNVEKKSAIGRDLRWSPTSTVGQRSWNRQLPLTTYFHSNKTHIPTLDDTPLTKFELESRTFVALIELLSILLEFTAIINGHLVEECDKYKISWWRICFIPGLRF